MKKILRISTIMLMWASFSILSLHAMEIVKPTVLLVGAGGQQGREYYSLLKDVVQFRGFVIPRPQDSIIKLAAANKIKIYKDLDDALKSDDSEIALVTVPHDLHDIITQKLLKAQKIIIKDKPLALSMPAISRYQQISLPKTPAIFTIVQRHFQEAFVNAKKDLDLIGSPLSFAYKYYLNLPNVTTGWRGEKTRSGGGVIIDMGYHILDVVNDFFGMPTEVRTELGYCFNEMRKEGLEDLADISVTYSSGLHGSIKLSRHASQKKEEFIINGTKGKMVITPTGYRIFDYGVSKPKKEFATQLPKEKEKLFMFTEFFNNRHNSEFLEKEFKRHVGTTMFIQEIYNNVEASSFCGV